MAPKLHQHYDRLTANERAAVDEIMRAVFSLWGLLQSRSFVGGGGLQPLHGGDPAERATDAVARWVLESRGA